MKALPEVKKELRDILPQGIDLTIQALKTYLPNGTDKYNDLILLESRYMETTRQLLQGIVSNEDAQIEFNKIRKDLLDFIDSLQESNLQEPGTAATGSATPDIYNGEVLYRIPPKMVMNEEVKCIVRLAFDRKVLVEDLELEEHDVMKDIRISDVMGVELLDPGDKAFQIRSINDTVQFVEKDLYTEWLFYVKPILEGTHPLVLKISVIEIRNGVERKRNVVLEEKVVIVSTPSEDMAGATKFESAGYMMQVAGGAASETPAAGDTKSVQPAPPPFSPAPPKPSPVEIPKWVDPAGPKPQTIPSRGNFRKMASALAGLVVLVIASWAIWSSINAPDPSKANVAAAEKAAQDWENAKRKNTREAYEEFVKSNPGDELATLAMTRLDSIETATWIAALDSGDPAAIQAYIAAYPNGRYAGDALAALERPDEEPAAVVADTQTIVKIEEPLPAKPKKQPAKKVDKNNKNIKPATKTTTETKADPTPTDKPKSEPKPTPKEEVKTDPNAPIPMRSAARLPVFPKCDNKDAEKERKCTEDNIRKFISKKLEYPEKALDQRIQGTVLVEFVVERDGSITDVHSLNDIGGGCTEAAVRLAKGLPKFKPGLDNDGKPVRILYRLPIRFVLR